MPTILSTVASVSKAALLLGSPKPSGVYKRLAKDRSTSVAAVRCPFRIPDTASGITPCDVQSVEAFASDDTHTDCFRH